MKVFKQRRKWFSRGNPPPPININLEDFRTVISLIITMNKGKIVNFY